MKALVAEQTSNLKHLELLPYSIQLEKLAVTQLLKTSDVEGHWH